MNTIRIRSDKSERMLVNLFIVYFYIIIAFLMSYTLTNQNLKTSLFYSVVILLAVSFASLAEHTKSSIMFNALMFLSFFTLFFTYGFRDHSAIDDPSYIRIFEQVSTIGWLNYFKLSTMEPGYLILNSIVGLFTNNYLYMQLVSSFIPLSLFYYGFKKYRRMISLPTAVFLLITMLYFQMVAVALVRMFIAISIVFIALRFIPKNKPKKYVFLILLATTFHYSAFFMLILVYFALNKKNLSRKVAKTYATLFVLSPFVFLFVGRFLVPLLGDRYQGYSVIEPVSLGFSTFTTTPLIMLLLFYYKKFKEDDQLYFKLFTTTYALSLIISLFGSMVGLGRLLFYSYAAFILGAAMVSKLIRLKSIKVFYSSFIIFYGFLYLYYSQFTNENHIPYLYPYKNIFFSL